MTDGHPTGAVSYGSLTHMPSLGILGITLHELKKLIVVYQGLASSSGPKQVVEVR